MEPKGSLPCSQESATGPHPGPDESSPPSHTLLHLRFSLLLSSLLRLDLPSGLLPSDFQPKFCTNFSRWSNFHQVYKENKMYNTLIYRNITYVTITRVCLSI